MVGQRLFLSRLPVRSVGVSFLWSGSRCFLLLLHLLSLFQKPLNPKPLLFFGAIAVRVAPVFAQRLVFQPGLRPRVAVWFGRFSEGLRNSEDGSKVFVALKLCTVLEE